MDKDKREELEQYVRDHPGDTVDMIGAGVQVMREFTAILLQSPLALKLFESATESLTMFGLIYHEWIEGRPLESLRTAEGQEAVFGELWAEYQADKATELSERQD